GRSRRTARPHPGGQHVVTGSGSYALLTMVALMGAAARPARAPAAARTLPLTVPPVRPPALGRDVVYGLARVDRSGRVADRTITGPDALPAAPGQGVAGAAMLVLERMGLTPADLLAAPAAGPSAPTFAEYIPVVSALVSDGCRRAYGSYWNRVTGQWGSRRIDEPTPSEIRQLVQHVRAGVVPRRNSRGGRSAAEHPIPALPLLHKHPHE